MRDTALAALRARHAVLLDRSKRRELTRVELAEVHGLGAAIDTLQAMEADQAG
jgi:hypothetical protein